MTNALAANAVRFSWYFGVNWLLAREAQRLVPYQLPNKLAKKPPNGLKGRCARRSTYLATLSLGNSGLRVIKPPCGSLLLTTMKSVAGPVSLFKSSSEMINDEPTQTD